ALLQSETQALQDRLYESHGVREASWISLTRCHPNRVQAKDVDLSMLLIDEKKLPARLPKMQLCEAPPWPTDPVIIVDARRPHTVPHRLAAGAALYVANKVFYSNP